MMRTDDIYPYLEELLSPKERLLMNFLFQIDRISGSLMHTDGESWIAAQDHHSHPMWIWKRRGELSLSSRGELVSVMGDALSRDPSLEINGDTTLEPLVGEAASLQGKNAVRKWDCTGYAMLKMPKLPQKGRIVKASIGNLDTVAHLVKLMYVDSGMEDISEGEALDIARDKTEKGQIRLLLDEEGKTVSMARICCTLPDMARINTVVTLPEERGKGWGRALMAHVSRELLREGRTPVLFAVKDYAPSNRCYRKAGFTPTGEIRVWNFT